MPASFSFGVCIHRSMDGWNDDIILGIKLSRLWEIYQHIGATALVLYLYLYSHPDGAQMVLSAKTVHAVTGMPDSTCRDQITKLIKKGYLVKREKGNVYDFFELSQG